MFKHLLKRPNLQFLKQIKKKFPACEIFLVGGSLRDILLKQPIKDYDFVIKNILPDDLQKFLKQIGRVDLVGRRFGIFKLSPYAAKKNKLKPVPKIEIDIALPRTEASWGTGLHQDFTAQANPYLDISQDLKRRDFTINAMAYNIFENKIIDPFGGQKDLKKKIIRAVLDPKKRFAEDFSRLIRAIRLACVLNFKIEKRTWQAISELKGKLTLLPKETISIELKKMLTGAPCQALNLLEKIKILDIIIPEILKMKGCRQPINYHSEGDVWNHTKLAVSILERKNKKRPLDIELVLAVLFHDIGKPITRRVEKQPFLAEKSNHPKKISFKGHNKKGAEIFSGISKRLKLSSAGINISEINFLICHHMIIFNSNPLTIKNTTLEKYFLRNKKQGENLLKLMELDALSSIPQKTPPNLSQFRIIQQRIRQIKNLSLNKQEAPLPLLNGDEVMKILNLKPSPKIGRILNNLREAQLAKKAQTKITAKKWIKDNYGKLCRCASIGKLKGIY